MSKPLQDGEIKRVAARVIEQITRQYYGQILYMKELASMERIIQDVLKLEVGYTKFNLPNLVNSIVIPAKDKHELQEESRDYSQEADF